MVLEINVASICASVPIFWPLLRPYIGAIFVTREFKIEHEIREDFSAPTSRDRTNSETELNPHYNDAYIMELVDPFNKEERGASPQMTRSDSRQKKSGAWLR